MHKIRTTIILLLIASSVLAQNALFPLKATNKKKEETEKNVAQYDYFFFNALIAKSQENQLEALSFFQQCIDLNSKEPAPFYESALINKNLGNYDLSISQIKKAVELAPNNKWYLLAYANILFFSEEYKKSAIQYKKLISKNPDNQEMYFMLADAYIYDNNFQQAINVYDELEKILGVDKTLSLQKQKLYVQINKKKKAIKELEKLLEKTPEDVEVLQLASELYFLNNQKDKAFQVLKKISTIQPDNGRIHLTLADYYRENGEKQKSYNELKQAFKSKKLDLETKIRILFSYLPLIKDNQEMRLQAHELVEILVEKHVDDYIVYMLYGDILYSENKLLEAKDKYLFSLELNKANIEAWTQVLFIQAEEKDFLQMIKTSNEALKYFPLEPVFYFFQGYSNKNFKNYDEAIQSFKTGIEFVVDNNKLLVEFYSSLAEAYHATKNHELSDSFYEKVLEIEPENTIALNNYAYYLSLRKVHLKKAKQMSLKSNKIEEDNGTYQDTYAWILYQNNEYEEAKKWIVKALNNGAENNPVVVEHYGDILYQLGDVSGAVVQWKKAKQIGSESEKLNNKIERNKKNE